MRRVLAAAVALAVLAGACGSGDAAAPQSQSQLPAGPLATTVPGDPSDANPAIEGQVDDNAPAAGSSEPGVSDEPAESGDPAQPPATSVPIPTAPGRAERVELVPFVDGLSEMTNIAHAGGNRLFVTLQPGEIVIVENGQVSDTPFLDITDRTNVSASERGLLDVAFHPNYPGNGFFFVNYTDLDGDTVVSRFEVGDDGDRADPASELVILQVAQPFRNHNGGHIEFGPGGFLYIAMGDGGSGGDPQGNGLDRQTLLGSILRIDVDAGSPYVIPADNPFVGGDLGLEEIWAYGVRNPWGFSFDALTGDLYFADVGQDKFEEVNVAPSSVGGLNFGWNAFEGDDCFRSALCGGEDLANHLGPVHVSAHSTGVCSITGGVVSRSPLQPDLWGNYLFGDLCDGRLWAMVREADGSFAIRQVADESISTVAIGADAAGNLYLADRASDSLFVVTAVPR